MKRRWRELSLLLALAMLLAGIYPCNVQAASRQYVKSLSISRKSLSLKKGQSKTISYKVKTQGRANKKISVKRSNSNVKISVKKGKIKITGRKAGNCRITVFTKSKNKNGKKIKKRILVKVVSGGRSAGGSSSDNQSSGSNSSGEGALPGYPAVPGGTVPRKTSRPVSSGNPVTGSTAIPGNNEPSPPGTGTEVEVTRSEWVAAVMQLTGYQEQEELFDYNTDDSISYSFTDISDCKDAGLLETAVKYGIVPESGERFYPDGAADREFLAVTSVRAIGFTTDESEITVTDKADLKYPAEDAIALQIGLLEIWNNQFDPDRAITKVEKQTAENVLSKIMAGREIDENHEDVLIYHEDVVVDEDATSYTVHKQNGEYTVMIPEGTEFDNISAGDPIVLPATEEYPEGIALVVLDSALSSNGGVRIITGTVPNEIMDFVDLVDIEGMAEPEIGEATAVEGVASVTITKGKKNAAKRNGIRGKSIEGIVDLEDQTKFTYQVEELGTTISFYLSALQYKIDFNKKGVKELYIGLPNVFALETDYKASKKFSKKIGDIPIQLQAGFSANLEVFLEAEIGGEISLDFKLSNDIGIQYYNGMFSLEKKCEPSLDIMVDADLDAGAKLQLGLYWMKGIMEIFSKEDPSPIYNIYTKWGLHGDATLHIRNDQYTSYRDLACVDLGYYLYGNVGVGDGSYLGETFQLKKTWEMFDEKNSPLNKAIHIENGKVVYPCTYQKSDALFENFINNYEFLCDDNTVHDTYAYYDDEHELFVQSDLEGVENPFSYEITDYDSDGSNELLIADMGHGYNDYNANGVEEEDEVFSTIKLQMFELENGSVKLQAERLCVMQDAWSSWYYHNIPAFETVCSGGTKIYRYQQDGKQVIAVENRYLSAAFADGEEIMFMAFQYNGQNWIDVGGAGYAGSDMDPDEINDCQNSFSNMGLHVDFEDMLSQGKYVMDYIDNPVLIGRSNCKIFYDDISDMWYNPNLLYKIGCISFARQ